VTATGTQHVVTLEGLAAATRHAYRAQSQGSLFSGPAYSFRTAPTPGTNAPVRLLVWGDSGKGDAAQMAVAAALVADSADVALHVGDIIYPSGEPQYYDPRFFTPYAGLLRRTPMWLVPGNHDVPNTQTYLDTWFLPTNPVDGSELYYSFDWGDVHFVALNSNAGFSTAVKNWITADLQATTRRWKIVFLHHTIYSCGNYHGSSSSLINALTPVFDANGVDLVLTGHDHHFERSFPLRGDEVVDAWMDPDYVQPGGTVYVVTGGGAGPRTAGSGCTHTARAIGISHYSRLTIQGDLLTLEAVNTARVVVDRMTLSKQGEPPPPPETVQVLEPMGGESVAVGSMLAVRWAASAGLTSLRIELSRSGNTGPWETLTAATPNDGLESFLIAAPATDNAWIRVADAADGIPSATGTAPFRIVATTSEEPPPDIEPTRFNFQPSSSPTPLGYAAATGAVFDPVLGWGWSASTSTKARNMMPGDPRDTFADVTNNATRTWELEVPNGVYRVSLTCGDPYTSATHRVAIEGQIVVSDVYTSGGNFVQLNDLQTVVADGRLSVTCGGGTQITHTKLCAVTVAGQDALVLQTPSGGESYCTGVPTEVRWAGQATVETVRIELSRDGAAGPWSLLTTAAASAGSATWTPASPSSGSCHLRLVTASGAVLATHAAPFAIVGPDLQVLEPNGGEIWSAGSQQTLEWTSTCAGEAVRIETSNTGPSGPWTTVIASTANDGDEEYVLQATDVGAKYIRVQALPAGPADASDAPFQVLAQAAITLQSPSGGEILRVGDPFEVRWTSTGTDFVRLELMTGDATWTALSVDVAAAGGRFDWTVGDWPGDGRRLRIVSTSDPSVADTSGVFTILPAPAAQPTLAFSFQPADAPVPSGMQADHGLPYSAERGFGWNTTMWVKKRNLLVNDCRDTFIQVVNTGSGTWNLDLPNGDYLVSLTCGDPYTSGTHRIGLEGTIVVQDVYAIGGVYVQRRELPVTVRDGQLTMTVGGNGQITSTKIACIEVVPVPRRLPRHHAVVDAAASETLRLAPGNLVHERLEVAFGLAQPTMARVAVHDVRGRRIAMLHRGMLPAGAHTLTWDARDATGRPAAAGVYFLTADLGGRRQTRRFLLVH
jgi:predicted phosphodiesterase